MNQLVSIIKSTIFVICVLLCLIPSLLNLEVFRTIIVTNYLLYPSNRPKLQFHQHTSNELPIFSSTLKMGAAK